MRSADLVRFAIVSVTRKRGRSAMSLLGVTIGVGAVVAFTGLGEGARRYVLDQFGSLGVNLLMVLPGKIETTGELAAGSPAPRDLTLEDAAALSRRVPEARRVVPVHLGNDTVSHRHRRRQVAVLGSSPEIKSVRGLRLAEGRFLPGGRLERSDAVAVLGADVARELFRGESPVGAVVRLGSWRMRVVGVLEPKGTQMALHVDQLVIVPVASALRIFNRSSLSEILVEVGSSLDLEAARLGVIEVLKERHQEEDFTCITQSSMIASLSRVLTALTGAVGGIAAISLFVAGIIVMNLMLVSVSERTHEVGLLKALGATQRQVLGDFLMEALVLVTTGAVLGLMVGWACVRLIVMLYPNLPAAPPAWAVAAVFCTALASGVGFGALPAWRASRLDPARALARS